MRLSGMCNVGMGGGEAGAGLGVGVRRVGRVAIAVMFARSLGCLHTIARLDHVGLERDWARPAVQFKEEAAGVAEDCAGLVASP